MKQARELLSLIRGLPGKKVLTLSINLDEATSDFVFEVTESGHIGFQRDHRKQLLTLLDYGINNSGGLIIRQFTKLSYEGLSEDGKLAMVPYKLIYAIFLGDGDYVPLSKSETEVICCTDAETGRRLKREAGVIYRGWQAPRAVAVQ